MKMPQMTLLQAPDEIPQSSIKSKRRATRVARRLLQVPVAFKFFLTSLYSRVSLVRA